MAAWLYTAAAVITGDSAGAALPLWFLLVVTGSMFVLGRRLRRADAGSALVASLPLYFVAALVAWRVSPAGYASVAGGPLDLSWLGALGDDFLAGAKRVGDLVGLTALVGYLWWRGLRLGRAVLAVDRVRTTFGYSLAAVIGALAVAAAVPGPGRAALAGRLGLILPLEVFAGLVTLALTRIMAQAAEGERESRAGAANDAPWLSLALVLSGVIVGLALLLSLVLSFGTISAALNALGPVGVAIVAGIDWLLFGFAYLLYLVLGEPINYLIGLVERARPVKVYQQPTPPKNACSRPDCATHLPQAPGIVVGIVLGVVLLAAIAVLIYLTYRSLREMRSHSVETDVGEERESLDGRALLGAQLRALFAGRRAEGAIAPEPLAAGSVRRIYRDLLRAAALVGLGRHASETPDEYARRLETTGGLGSTDGASGAARQRASDDLTALTHAYDEARYAEREPDPAELRGLRAGGERVRASLRARDAARRG